MDLETSTEQVTPADPAPAAPDDASDYVSHTSDGFTTETNAVSADQLEANATSEEPPPDGPDPEAEKAKAVKDAATELGKRSAAARKEKPAEEKPEEKEAKGEEEKSADEQEPKKDRSKPRHGAVARMQQATREAAELKRQLASRDAEITRLKSSPRPTPEAQHQADPTDPEPVAEQYRDDPESVLQFVRDQARWSARQEYRAEQEKAAQNAKAHEATSRREEAQERIEGAKVAFRAKMDKAKAADPTFPDHVREFTDLLKPSWMLPEGEPIGALNALADELMLRSSDPAALMLYFADREEEVQRIATLGARDFHRELGKIEYQLSAAATSPAPRVETSRARPPIHPVNGSPHAADPTDLESLDFDAYVTQANALDRKRRRQRG